MKYLIIPDVHNRIDVVETLIDEVGSSVNMIVFLGDYFDSIGDDADIARATASWLSRSIRDPKRIHLMGNHDIPYRWNNIICPCLGYSREKHRAIVSGGFPMSDALWSKVKPTHIITPARGSNTRPVVLSHAGFNLLNLYGAQDAEDLSVGGRCYHLRNRRPYEHIQAIQGQGHRCVAMANRREAHFWLNRGTRTGDRDNGGPFWMDRRSFVAPLPGIDQIVGHSIVDTPIRLIAHNDYISFGRDYDAGTRRSDIWFIDGVGRYAAIIDTSDVTDNGGFRITPISAVGTNINQPIQFQYEIH